MSRTYRHCPDWALKSYEDYLDQDFHRKAMEELGLWRRNYHRRSWESRIHLREGRRPLLNDGNFQRRHRTRKELKQYRVQLRRQRKLAIKRGDPDANLERIGPWCRICGGDTPRDH